MHGDYRLDNTMLAADDPGRIVAVLDWEMATLGDPLSDVGLFLVYWGRDQSNLAGDDPAMGTSAGFLSREEVAERYANASGRDVSQLDFYEMLASYKLAIILEGIHARYLMGKTVGEGFDHIGVMVESIANAALEPGTARKSPRCAADGYRSRGHPGSSWYVPTRLITARHNGRDEPGNDETGPTGCLGDEHIARADR